jgi:hypothetical protein
MPQLVFRKAARERGLGQYVTGRPCAHGHVAKRYAANGECIVCTKLRAAGWKKTPKEYRLIAAGLAVMIIALVQGVGAGLGRKPGHFNSGAKSHGPKSEEPGTLRSDAKTTAYG